MPRHTQLAHIPTPSPPPQSLTSRPPHLFSSVWARVIPLIVLPSTSDPVASLHLHALHTVPALLWRRLLHALLPALLLNVGLQQPQRSAAPLGEQPVYPVQVIR